MTYIYTYTYIIFNGQVYYTGAKNQTLKKSFSAYHFYEGLMRNIDEDIM